MITKALNGYGRHSLAALRIMTALLFIQHGVQKLFFWPPSEHHSPPFVLFSMAGVGGILEFFGGLLILVGLFTRPVAFILAGQMAVAYWLFHFGMMGMNMPNGWMPVVNGGDAAILFCFVFLHLVFAGAGAWSIDEVRQRRHEPAAV